MLLPESWSSSCDWDDAFTIIKGEGVGSDVLSRLRPISAYTLQLITVMFWVGFFGVLPLQSAEVSSTA